MLASAQAVEHAIPTAAELATPPAAGSATPAMTGAAVDAGLLSGDLGEDLPTYTRILTLLQQYH